MIVKGINLTEMDGAAVEQSLQSDAFLQSCSPKCTQSLSVLLQVVALVKGNTLVVANAGDSRCVCSRGGEAVAMTQDHKPTDTEEFNRITKVTCLLQKHL